MATKDNKENQIKVDDFLMTRVRETSNNLKQAFQQLGNIEYQLSRLQMQKKDVQEHIDKMQENISEIQAEINQRYGKGELDIETGTFKKM